VKAVGYKTGWLARLPEGVTRLSCHRLSTCVPAAVTENSKGNPVDR